MIIDGENAVLGRIGTYVAKKALSGEEIKVVNSEKIVVSGKKEIVFAKYSRLRKMGTPRKGPFIPSTPGHFVKRMIRNMLPYKNPRGKEALEKIKFYKGIPSEFQSEKLEKPVQSELKTNSVSVADICKHIGGKQE